jgi:hypothetical protein
MENNKEKWYKCDRWTVDWNCEWDGAPETTETKQEIEAKHTDTRISE